jgi:hypothetical protein
VEWSSSSKVQHLKSAILSTMASNTTTTHGLTDTNQGEVAHSGGENDMDQELGSVKGPDGHETGTCTVVGSRSRNNLLEV